MNDNLAKFFSYGPLLLFVLLSVQAVLLIAFNAIAPDRLFFTLN